MQEKVAVKVVRLSKQFVLPHKQARSFKQVFVGLGKKNRKDYSKVLSNVCFEVQKGEFFGIVGRNGSGKSTLLKILAGVYSPTSGGVHVDGSLTPFIELGVGFNPELSGRDNVFLNGALLGFSRKQMEMMYDDIVAFAELGEHMDVKLKNYSSGMQVRLAFSIAIRAESDILLIDEVLAVGDAAFQQKCFDYFRELKEKNKTVIFVSHDIGSLRQYCDRGILIEKGEIVSSGKISKVVNDYIQLLSGNESKKSKENTRWGDGNALIDKPKVEVSRKDITISYVLSAKEKVKDPICGLIIKNSDGISIIDSNTKWKDISLGDLEPSESRKITWNIPNIFKEGTYSITVAAAHSDAIGFYDWREDIGKFQIINSETTAGLVSPGDIITVTK